jgi:hypothetical protein
MFLELNITNEEKLLLTNEAFITSINICNTGSTDVELGLYKLNQYGTDKYYFLKNVALKKAYVFLVEDLVISEGDSFYISVGPGSCSVIIDYK